MIHVRENINMAGFLSQQVVLYSLTILNFILSPTLDLDLLGQYSPTILKEILHLFMPLHR